MRAPGQERRKQAGDFKTDEMPATPSWMLDHSRSASSRPFSGAPARMVRISCVQVFTEDVDQRRPKSPWDLAPPADQQLKRLLAYPGVESNVIAGARCERRAPAEGGHVLRCGLFSVGAR